MRARLLAGLVLVLLGAVTVPALQHLLGLRTAYDMEQFFPTGSPEVERYHRFREAFGLRDTSVLLLLHGQQVFSPAGVEVVRRLSRAVAAVEGVEEVTSLSTAVEVRAGQDNDMVVDQPLGEQYPGPRALPAIRSRLLFDPLFRDRLVSRDGRATCILARLDPEAARPERAAAVERELRAAVERAGGVGEFSLLLGGAPLVRARYTELVRRDLGTFMPLVLGLFAVLLLVIFRSPWGVVLPLGAVGLATVWTLGGFAALGGKLDTLTSLVPVLLLVVGLSDGVHLLARFRELSARLPEGRGALRATLTQVGSACLMTSVTTAVGFCSLILSDMRAVRTFGAVTAVGVMLALLSTVVFMPAVLALLPRRWLMGRRRGGPAMDRALGGIAGICLERPGRVLAAVGLALVASLAGASLVSRDIRLYGNLTEGHPILAAERFADRHLGGALTVEVLLDAGRPGGAASAPAMGELARLERWLQARPEVHTTRSVLDPLRAVQRALTGADPGAASPSQQGPPPPLATREDVIAQYLLLLSMGEQDPTEPYLDFSRRRARISVQVPDLPHSRVLDLVEGIEAQARQAPAGLDVKVTGSTAILHRVYHSLVQGMMRSFGLAFLVIVAIITLMLRSLRLGLISLAPNLVPLAVTLGFMGLAGINLSPTTSLVFAVAFGIAVDDTIHFLNHYKTLRSSEGMDAPAAVRAALLSSGRPIIWTSVVLVVGFSVLLASAFLGNVYFGLIIAVAMIAAVLADLLLLPVLLLLLDRRQYPRTPASPGE